MLFIKIILLLVSRVTQRKMYKYVCSKGHSFKLAHWAEIKQRAKKVVSDSPGLVDFAIGLVNSVVNLPDGQVRFFEQFE